MEYTTLPHNTTTETLPRNGFLEIENLVKSYPTQDKGKFTVLDHVN
ncbi:ABC transporter ATP-binding protein, partial [Dolichospermum sp. LEGE 00246]|nr:ABC transporter ATP-binding protein [Dolichospermum sp. LEGE 00246]